jgi:hypothetical protein
MDLKEYLISILLLVLFGMFFTDFVQTLFHIFKVLIEEGGLKRGFFS